MNSRPLTAREKREYDRLAAHAEQMDLDLSALMKLPAIYGYVCALSGDEIPAKKEKLALSGAKEIVADLYVPGKKAGDGLLSVLNRLEPGDTFVAASLSDISPSATVCAETVRKVVEKRCLLIVGDIGRIGTEAEARLIASAVLSFGGTGSMNSISEANTASKSGSGLALGKLKYSDEQIKMALAMLDRFSYSQVAKMTGISKSTLIRRKR